MLAELSIDQPPPAFISASVFGLITSFWASPTASRIVPERTAAEISCVVNESSPGDGTTDQADPFQCSTSA